MKTFSYVATNASRQPVTGKTEQIDRAAVIVALQKQGLRPISVKETSLAGKFDIAQLLKSNRVKPDILVMMTRQLSAMVGAGVPLIRALSSLSEHSESPALQKILAGVIKDVEGGAMFGNALAKYPDTFSDVYVNMVKAGEAAGILDAILKRLALQQEKSASIRKKIKSAMAYPSVLIGITVLAFLD